MRFLLTGAFIIVALMTTAAWAETDESLVMAAQNNDVGAVQALLAAGKSADAATADGTTALHWAVQNRNLSMLELLINGGAHVGTINRFGATPLILAASGGDIQVVERLIAAGADPNQVPTGKETPLMLAARTGAAGIVAKLLSAGANVDAAEPVTGQTALMWAAAEGQSNAIAALLRGGASISSRSKMDHSALYFAVRNGDVQSVARLLEAGADANETLDPDPTPSGELDAKYPPGTTYAPLGDSMLVLAINNANFEVAELLLKHGADANAAGTNWTALHALVRVRNYEEAQYPAPVGKGSVDSLNLAKELLAHGADPNARGDSLTPRRPGGDQNYVELLGATPFLLASKAADVPMMRTLLAAGARPDILTYQRTTPLMVAAGLGCVPGQWIEPEPAVLETVKLLVEELGANVNDVNEFNETTMHGAVYRGALSVIRYLAEKGARTDIKDADGLTPLVLAQEGAHKPIAIAGPRVILFRFPPTTAALLQQLEKGSR